MALIIPPAKEASFEKGGQDVLMQPEAAAPSQAAESSFKIETNIMAKTASEDAIIKAQGSRGEVRSRLFFSQAKARLDYNSKEAKEAIRRSNLEHIRNFDFHAYRLSQAKNDQLNNNMKLKTKAKDTIIKGQETSLMFGNSYCTCAAGIEAAEAATDLMRSNIAHKEITDAMKLMALVLPAKEEASEKGQDVLMQAAPSQATERSMLETNRDAVMAKHTKTASEDAIIKAQGSRGKVRSRSSFSQAKAVEAKRRFLDAIRGTTYDYNSKEAKEANRRANLEHIRNFDFHAYLKSQAKNDQLDNNMKLKTKAKDTIIKGQETSLLIGNSYCTCAAGIKAAEAATDLMIEHRSYGDH